MPMPGATSDGDHRDVAKEAHARTHIRINNQTMEDGQTRSGDPLAALVRAR